MVVVLSATRNQGRQKLARLKEVRRRQVASDDDYYIVIEKDDVDNAGACKRNIWPEELWPEAIAKHRKPAVGSD